VRKIDFTIAVAIYNVEAHLKECLDSIIGQLDDSMQLILVDDGSTDGCGKICDFYAQKDNRIEVIHQKNGGLSAARNTAIERAEGKWIVFVDGDDKLTENAMASMKKHCKDNAQLVIFDYIDFDANGPFNNCHVRSRCVFETTEHLKHFRASTLYLHSALADKFSGGVLITSWAKMWSLQYIKEHGYRFNTDARRGEDNAFSFTSSRNMTKVCVSTDHVYEYRVNRTGIMRRFEPKVAEHFRVLLSIIAKDMADHGEMKNKLIRGSFNELCADGVCYSFMQTLLHKDCTWNRKERIAWLKSLQQQDWIKEAEKYNAASKSKRSLMRLMKNEAYGTIDLGCRVLRRLMIMKNRK